MRFAALFVVLLSSTTAYKLSPRPLTPLSRRSTAGAAAALGTSLPALAASDWWVEVNKPPIELAPFKINPVGWTFFAGYGAYLAWTLFKPESEAEQRRTLQMLHSTIDASTMDASKRRLVLVLVPFHRHDATKVVLIKQLLLLEICVDRVLACGCLSHRRTTRTRHIEGAQRHCLRVVGQPLARHQVNIVVAILVNRRS